MKNSEEIIRLAKEGKPIQEIADLLGYKSTSHIVQVLNKNNQPARYLDKNGDLVWELHGKLHREDGPAIEEADGTRRWYLHDKCHREDGPAIEKANGSRGWYLHDKCHREDGPAFEFADGTRWWYLHGKRHREDGHAIERANGDREWWWRGRGLKVKSQEEFEKLKHRLLIQDIFS